MATEELLNVSNIPVDFISNIGQLALWLQGIGVIILIWLVFQIISFYLNRKKMKEIYHIKEDISRIEKKIDKLIKIKK